MNEHIWITTKLIQYYNLDGEELYAYCSKCRCKRLIFRTPRDITGEFWYAYENSDCWYALQQPCTG